MKDMPHWFVHSSMIGREIEYGCSLKVSIQVPWSNRVHGSSQYLRTLFLKVVLPLRCAVYTLVRLSLDSY